MTVLLQINPLHSQTSLYSAYVGRRPRSTPSSYTSVQSNTSLTSLLRTAHYLEQPSPQAKSYFIKIRICTFVTHTRCLSDVLSRNLCKPGNLKRTLFHRKDGVESLSLRVAPSSLRHLSDDDG